MPTFGLPSSVMRCGPAASERSGRVWRHRGDDGVQQVTAPPAVQRGDRVRHAEAERPQLGRVGLAGLAVHLVHRKHDVRASAAQHADHRLVRIGRTDLAVDHEHDDVSRRDRQLGLGRDPSRPTAGIGHPAAGVDDREVAPRPRGVVRDPVAGHPGDVLDHRLAAADQPVHQRGLADVGATDDGDHGQRPRVSASSRSRSASGASVVLASSMLTATAPSRARARVRRCGGRPAGHGRVRRRLRARSATGAGRGNRHVERRTVRSGQPRAGPGDSADGGAAHARAEAHHRHDRRAGAHREPGQAVPHVAEVALAAAALGKHREHAAAREHVQAGRERSEVGGVAVDRDLADPAEREARAGRGTARPWRTRGPVAWSPRPPTARPGMRCG